MPNPYHEMGFPKGKIREAKRKGGKTGLACQTPTTHAAQRTGDWRGSLPSWSCRCLDRARAL